MQLTPVKREFCLVTPVVFISTKDEKGVLNVAPFSNLMPLLRSTDLVCIASWHRRDTLHNIRRTGEFVISVPPVGMADQVMKTAMHYPPEANEYEMAGLQPRPSKCSPVPGVGGCLAWMTCRLVRQYVEKEYVLIVGRVMDLEAKDEVLGAENGFDPNRANPLLACLNNRGIDFTTISETGRFETYGAMFPDGKDVLAHLYDN